MAKVNKNEKGMVLVTVIIFGAIIIMLGVALLSTGVMEVKSGNYFERNTQAYYVAKAGADIVAKNIINKHIVIPSYPATFTGSIEGDSYAVDVSKVSNIISIKSIGQSKGVKNEVVLNVLEKVSTSTIYNFDMALFANNSINASSTINGSIGTNANTANGITFNWGASINGEAYVGPDGDVNQVISQPQWSNIIPIGNRKVLSEARNYLSPIMPIVPIGLTIPANDIKNYGGTNFVSGIKDGVMQVSGSINYEYIMNSDVNFSKISLLNDKSITINVGDKDRVIVVGTLDASNGDLYITGSGSLKIFVTNAFIYGSSYINWDNSNLKPQKLQFYYYGNSPVSFVSDSRFCGTFQSNLAPLTLSGGGNFNGTIISATTGTINVDGGHQAYTNVLYAPNASVNILGGGNFKGSIIGNNVNVTGGGSVTFNSAGDVSVPVTSGGSVTYEKLNYQ